MPGPEKCEHHMCECKSKELAAVKADNKRLLKEKVEADEKVQHVKNFERLKKACSDMQDIISNACVEVEH